MLLARPYPVSLLCHFYRGAVAAQRGLWPSRKQTRLQHNSSGVSVDMEAASAFCHTVRSADRSSVPLLPKAVAPYPAAASGRLGGQSVSLCDLDYGLWRQIKRYCAASPFHLTVARRSPVFIAASSIAAVLFFVILILEKRYHNSAGAEVCSDHAAHRCVANLPQMPLPNVAAVFDAEVAKKALEQFPEFAKSATEIVSYYKDVVYKGFDENTASVNSFYAMCDAINDTLREQLQDEHLTFEEKSVIIDKMIELAKMKAEKDTENKKFISGVIGKVTLGIGIAVGAVAAVLGAQTSISSGTSEDDADNSDLDIVDYQ